MKLVYIKTIRQFLTDVNLSQYMSQMQSGARKIGLCPTESELNSWNNNSIAMAKLLSAANLPEDVMIGFEYLVPVGGRIDCVLLGCDESDKPNMLHIELKQWSNENVTPFYRTETTCFSLNVAIDGYRNGTHIEAHPAEQTREYQMHLCNYLQVFENDVNLYGCAYCYNYKSVADNCALLDEVYIRTVLQRHPLYCGDQIDVFITRLQQLFRNGNGKKVYELVANSTSQPTERLQDAAKKMFDGSLAQEVFALIGGQLDAYQSILGAIERTDKENEKTVVIVKGGPGTGKSVIALRLISGLAKTDKYPNVFYSTRSSSLRNGLKSILNGVYYNDDLCASAAGLICNNIDFRPHGKGENYIDALIIDEAHRINQKANDQTDRCKEIQTHLSQIMAMLYTARVCVFFIDDRQSVKSSEIGTSENIKEAALNYYKRIQAETENYVNNEYPKLPKKIEKAKSNLDKCITKNDTEKIREAEKKLHSLEGELKYGMSWVSDVADVSDAKINIIEIELQDQFRCNGSNNYINWLDQVLYGDKSQGELIDLDTDAYEFGVFDTPQELYAKIRSLDGYAQYADQLQKDLGEGFTYDKLYHETKNKSFTQSARLAAGYCWKWNDRTLANGDLPHDVTIPEYDFSMPWETKARPRGDYAKKYAENADEWCNQHEGVNQIGCIYSLQGWETDYIGVIIGPDLIYDRENDCLRSDNRVKTHSVPKEKSNHDRLVKNIYRVLLSRGKKGCFIFCCNKEVGEFFKRHMNR